jgi:hypothetical protein
MYFFHIQEPTGIIIDEEGIELNGLEEVRAEAVQAARDILSDRLRSGQPLDDQSFIVTDNVGDTVLKFPLKLAITDGGRT